MDPIAGVLYFVLPAAGAAVVALLLAVVALHSPSVADRLTALGFVHQPGTSLHRATLADGTPVLHRATSRDGQAPWFGFGTVLPAPSLHLAQTRGGGEPTGDPAFDQVCAVGGSPADLALLTEPLRTALRSLAARVQITDGTLWIEHQAFREQTLEALREIAAAAARVPLDPILRLIGAAFDPIPGVRARSLRWAVLHGDQALVDHLADTLAHDPDPGVRAAVALWSRDSAALMAAATDPRIPEPVRQQAAAVLCEEGTDDERLQTAAALAASPAASIRAAAIRLLHAVGAAGEPGLVALLGGASSPDELGAVVAALGEIGTTDAVPALRARQTGLPAALSEAIDDAVVAIQATGTVPPGVLSLEDHRRRVGRPS